LLGLVIAGPLIIPAGLWSVGCSGEQFSIIETVRRASGSAATSPDKMARPGGNRAAVRKKFAAWQFVGIDGNELSALSKVIL